MDLAGGGDNSLVQIPKKGIRRQKDIVTVVDTVATNGKRRSIHSPNEFKN